MQANALKGKIVAAGYSQNSLAEAMRQSGVRISKNTLSSKINERVPFNTDEVVCICELLGIVDNNEKAYIFL
nr:DUF739 family protein [Clostridia bacterium]